jgi:hypothetical protein
MRKTDVIEQGDFKLIWTTIGDSYRYVIFHGIHIVNVNSGSEPEDPCQATVDNMTEALNRWIRIASYGRKDLR